ncbi:MAG: SgcJ/EcaC family oxidoreductase [Verrucomicrobiota bacterium]
MKAIIPTLAAIATSGLLLGEEVAPEIAGLEKAAMDFVTAYNAQDAEAISKLFTEDGEITDLRAEDLLSGREAIKLHYESVFAGDDDAELALEVESVRLVAPGLAIEDGLAHVTPAGDDNEPPRSAAYTAVLSKVGDTWLIASSRVLVDTTSSAGQLAELARLLNGEWTAKTPTGVRLDLAIGWDSTGKFLTGDMLVTTNDAEPQEGSLRIAWNAARKSVVSWFFDANGGASQGIWTPTEDGWLVRSEGTTADGENSASNLEIARDGEVLIWKLSNCVIDGERLPDGNLRLVAPAPAPDNN